MTKGERRRTDKLASPPFGLSLSKPIFLYLKVLKEGLRQAQPERGDAEGGNRDGQDGQGDDWKRSASIENGPTLAVYLERRIVNLNIKNPEAHQLAHAIARATGQSITRVVTEALRERLKGSSAAKARRAFRNCWRSPTAPPRM